MSDGKERSDWNKFSVLIATIHNVNCSKKSDAISFQDIHPFFIGESIQKKTHYPSKEEVTKGLLTLKKALNG
jgi:hypothetical protein